MKLECKNCQHEAEPVEVTGGLTCAKCHYPFDYFQVGLHNNDKKQKRLAKERLEANNKLTRGLKKR